jgi:hypothetical protein
MKQMLKNMGQKIRGAWNNSASARGKIASFCSATGKWTYKLRAFVLAIPIVAIAVILAVSNMATLPAAIAIGLPNIVNGILVFQEVLVSKILAVFIPLLVTAFCLLMMFLSKRISFPFLVSLFSLILPIFFSIAAKLPG